MLSYILHMKFDTPFDLAFKNSFGAKAYIPDDAAVHWVRDHNPLRQTLRGVYPT